MSELSFEECSFEKESIDDKAELCITAVEVSADGGVSIESEGALDFMLD